MKKVKNEENPENRKQLAREIALPIRKKLVAQFAEAHRYLLATVSTNGAMGNVTNFQQHVMPTLLTEPGKELAKLMGEELPADAMPSGSYNGPLRLIVPTVRGSLSASEDLQLKVIILAAASPENATIYFRTIGKGNYNKIPLTHIARSVYSARIPAGSIETDLEYYIEVNTIDGQEGTFPATAPDINQTVVIMKEK